MYSIDVSSEKASKKLPTITTSSATPRWRPYRSTSLYSTRWSRSCRDTGRDAVERLLKHLSECLTRTLSLKLLTSPAKSIANVFTNTWLVFIFKSQHLKPLLSSLFLFICNNDWNTDQHFNQYICSPRCYMSTETPMMFLNVTKIL